MKKHSRHKKARSAGLSKKRHKGRSPKRAKMKPHSKSKLGKRARVKASLPSASGQRAADEIPTLEQVTITCANCGRPFKLMKLKGISLEGTICQRCSLGEMELPESFG